MKYFISFIFVLLFIGCGQQPEPRIIYKTKIVKEPVKCKIPKVHCDFNKPGFGVVEELLKCIKKQKEAMKVCE